jgi:hypothetical protein
MSTENSAVDCVKVCIHTPRRYKLACLCRQDGVLLSLLCQLHYLDALSVGPQSVLCVNM